MSEKLSRRSFFRLAGGGIAAAVIAPKLLLDKVINIPVEFGWTWFVDKSKVPPTLSELVTTTLRANTQKIADNLGQSNALLMKLNTGEKIRLQIDNISIDEQNKRMEERTRKRLEERDRKKMEVFKKSQEDLINGMEETNKEQNLISRKNIWEKYKNHNEIALTLAKSNKDEQSIEIHTKVLACCNAKLVELYNESA